MEIIYHVKNRTILLLHAKRDVLGMHLHKWHWACASRSYDKK